METIRWKQLLIATDTGQLRRLTLQLDANEIRHAIGSHRPLEGSHKQTMASGTRH
jgi:hypothetical protein